MKKIFILFVFITLTGCASIVANIASSMKETSKYQPAMTSGEDVDEYISLIQLNNKEVVSDELGTYYHSMKLGVLKRVFFNSSDEGLLRNIFSSSVGMLAPVYKIKDTLVGPIVFVDWKSTKQRHNVLKNKLNLNILPLSVTKKYQKLFEKNALKRTERYNIHTRPNFLKEIDISADYFVDNSLSEDYYNNYSAFKRRVELLKDKNSMMYKGAVIVRKRDLKGSIRDYKYLSERMILLQNEIAFMPTEIIENSFSGRARRVSHCMSMDLGAFKAELVNNLSDGFYPFHVTKIDGNVDTTSSSELKRARDKSQEKELKKEHIKFTSLLNKQNISIAEANRACIVGFSALKITGSINSEKLK